MIKRYLLKGITIVGLVSIPITVIAASISICVQLYNPDSDNDGIPDYIEQTTGTDPYDDDTDDDGLTDGKEDMNVNGIWDFWETNPRQKDTDGDGILDGTEKGLTAPEGNNTNMGVFVADADPTTTTDPLNPDTDGDGLMDGAEDVNKNGKVDSMETDPNLPDTDNDDVLDGQEIIEGTNPIDSDSDNDGYNDGEEKDAGTDPLDENDTPTTGNIHIVSTPANAKVYSGGNYGYSGQYQGATELTIPNLLTGKYVIRVAKAGYEVFNQLVEVTSGMTSEVAAGLIPAVDFEFTVGQKIQANGANLDVSNYSTPFVVDWNNDGKKDLILGNGNGVITYFENQGTDGTPTFTTESMILSQGSFLAPFVVNWNINNRKDLIIGDRFGKVRFYQNVGLDDSPAFIVATAQSVVEVFDCAVPFVVDWNNDTRKDLVVGDGQGKIHLFINTGTDELPAFGSSTLIFAGGLPIDVGANAAPFVTDFNGDGKKDLLIGERYGKLTCYLNQGEDGTPTFSTGSFVQANGSDIDVGDYAVPFVVDWNNDGIKDLVVGNFDGEVMLYLGKIVAVNTPGKAVGGGLYLQSNNYRASFQIDVSFSEGNSSPGGFVKYLDHKNRRQLITDSITSFVINGNEATIKGTGQFVGIPGQVNFVVRVIDKVPDYFSIETTGAVVHSSDGNLISGSLVVEEQ
ncbi:MAG: FG-GAP-like repeat-containing protein [bacterium]|nr:FG-GAP-like repeat-containing protein [bacterium]